MIPGSGHLKFMKSETDRLYFIKQLFHFTKQEALSCLFPFVIFLTLAVSRMIHFPWLHRYDFILLVCLFMQVAMVLTKLETKDELKVITVFHLIGLGLELYKVRMGSWAYPEQAWTKIGGVPLYSGFMYASVASYICQAWRRFELRLDYWPPGYWTIPLAAAVYLNFFTHHFWPDLRLVLTLLLLLLFYKSSIFFKVNQTVHRMPLMISFVLTGFFIWIAENISTYFGAWQYPDQTRSWHLVHWGKISSWFLLVIISFVVVAQLKHLKEELLQKKGPVVELLVNN
jgi:uncharacterized membrane protein YoaT (DUF817 family)